jgi:hypothetical protein
MQSCNEHTEWTLTHRMDTYTQNGHLYTEWTPTHGMDTHTRNGHLHTRNGHLYTEWTPTHRMDTYTVLQAHLHRRPHPTHSSLMCWVYCFALSPIIHCMLCRLYSEMVP